MASVEHSQGGILHQQIFGQLAAVSSLQKCGLEQLGVKGVPLMEWPSALVWLEVLRDPIDEGLKRKVTCPCGRWRIMVGA